MTAVGLSARPLAPGDVEQLASWFDDAGTSRWVGHREYPHQLLTLATRLGRWAFVIVDDQEFVALIDVECEEDDPSVAAIAVVVAPAKRGQRVGRRLFAVVSSRPELVAVDRLVGEVEAGNVAAERCVVAAGFEVEGTARDAGFTRYVLSLAESP